ncbi:MAG TPA: hypothetical protein VM487_03210 [Phycisphaerae bacterium]|nr:hypothetical protein [Planctomycetota bacterium]HUU94723.1 hypothetical protein [Phycisphaerae bacterium]
MTEELPEGLACENAAAYMCELCQKEFSSARGLNIHRGNAHNRKLRKAKSAKRAKHAPPLALAILFDGLVKLADDSLTIAEQTVDNVDGWITDVKKLRERYLKLRGKSEKVRSFSFTDE